MTEIETAKNALPASAPELDGRLACAASLVRPNAVVADVGTDHAYLPVFLLLRGGARFAIASDVNRGPLERARQNAAKYGAADRMRFVLADGLNGVEPERDGVTDIVICGMGGELMARIMGESEYTRREGVRLILQPMSAADDLRLFLAEAGYRILEEKLCRAAGKIYTCLSVEYDGVKRTFTPAELLLGKWNMENRGPLFGEFAEHYASRLRVQIAGKKKGGVDPSAEEECLAEIEAIREDCT